MVSVYVLLLYVSTVYVVHIYIYFRILLYDTVKMFNPKYVLEYIRYVYNKSIAKLCDYKKITIINDLYCCKL